MLLSPRPLQTEPSLSREKSAIILRPISEMSKLKLSQAWRNVSATQVRSDKKRWIWAGAHVLCLQSGCSAASTEPTLMHGHGHSLWSTTVPFTPRPLVTTSARGLLHKADIRFF